MDFMLSRKKSNNNYNGKSNILGHSDKNNGSNGGGNGNNNSNNNNGESQTIRMAVLGGKGAGKSSFISRLTVDLVPEVHYPTLKQNNWLMHFTPKKSRISRCLLDEHWHERMAHDIHDIQMVDGCIYPSPVLSQHLILSKSLFHNATNDFIRFKQNYLSSKSSNTLSSTISSSSSVSLSHINSNYNKEYSPDKYIYEELNGVKDRQENMYYSYITNKCGPDDSFDASASYYNYHYYENEEDEENDKIQITAHDLNVLKKTSMYAISSISTEDDVLQQIRSGTNNSYHNKNFNNSNNNNNNNNNKNIHNMTNGNGLSTINSQGNPTFYVAGHDTNVQLKSLTDQHQMKLPVIYSPPSISPMLIDIIDTPPFDPEMVVPFLEVSLFRNIGKEYLHNLANDPRRPVSTRSMLTASGASELNGNVDCYILMYSCYPENIEPPQYDDNNNNNNTRSKTSNGKNQEDEQIALLENIRETIEEAWEEYYNYKNGWENGQEGDVYSVMYNLKKLWGNKNKTPSPSATSSSSTSSIKGAVDKTGNWKAKYAKRNFKAADDPLAPPPFIIVATHTASELTSPVLLQKGKDLATEWGCSFVAVDNYVDYNVEEALCVSIREVVERRRLKESLKK